MDKPCRKLVTVMLLGSLNVLVSLGAEAQGVTREEASDLMAQCQAERRDLIAPERERAIEDCIAERLRGPDECRRQMRNYGEHSNVGAATGMFWDLPICQEALAADRYFKMNPGRSEFTPN